MQQETVSSPVMPQWPPPGLKEYLLAALPDDPVGNRVMAEKRSFAGRYGIAAAAIGRPHIPVAGFWAKEEMEATLIRWIQRICSLHKSFPVTLNNYSGIPAHTVYLQVQDPLPFRQLAQQLKVVEEYVSAGGSPPAASGSRPRIAIAAGLAEPVYHKAMLDYSQKTFHETFTVQRLLLLKREPPQAACETVNVFPLLPQDTLLFGEVA
jgi:hypothetical protein